MSVDEIRDPEIGRLLSGGPVAEHEPGYWDRFAMQWRLSSRRSS